VGRIMTQIGTPEYFAEMSCNEQHDSFVLVARRAEKVNAVLIGCARNECVWGKLHLL
jgi:hypothetical protein